MPDIVSKLSGTTKNFTTGLMSDPHKIEGLISMVRTVTPLTSTQTVTKVNTYLPLFEKVSTLLGMYSFLNRAQTFRPIESLNAKSPGDMISSLMKNGNIPVSKLLSQPFIANNMEKIMGTVASNMIKNGGLNDLLKNGNISDILSNGNINDMLSAFSKNSEKDSSGNGNIDLNSLMETFMPILNSMSASNINDNENSGYKSDINQSNYNDTSKNMGLRNENYLPDDDEEDQYEQELPNHKYTNNNNYEKFEKPKNDKYDRSYQNDKYDRSYQNDKYEGYDKSMNYNENKNNYNENDNQKPIRIKQRKRR